MGVKPADKLSLLTEYFFSRKLREIQELRGLGHDVINLGIGSPDLPPSGEVTATLNQSAQNPKNHGYQPYNGNLFLREAISSFMEKTYGVEINSSNEILPLMGSKEGILHILMAYTNAGDQILVPELGYPAYSSIARMLGLQINYYPLTSGYAPDFKNFTNEMNRAKVIWINYPHMPTGAVASKEILQQVVDFGLENNILVAHDNPYSLVLNDNPLSIFKANGSKEIAVELHSLSKSHNMAGWRVGWVCGSSEFIKNILTIKSNIDSGMFKGIEEAAVEALSLPNSWHVSRNDIYRKRQLLAFQLLKKFDCSYNEEQSGMFVWGKIPSGSHSDKFSEQILKEHHIFVTPGSLFGEKGEDYIRISLCSNEKDYQKALNRVSS